jgi:DNA-binding NtrC family response regulator
MDVLRSAVGGQFDLVTIGMDMSGFGRTGAIQALRELTPHVALIALHKRASEVLHVAALNGVSAVLPRPVSARVFVYVVARALEQKQPLEHTPLKEKITTRPILTLV